MNKTTVKPTKEVNEFLTKNNSSQITNGVKLSELLRRTEITYEKLKEN